MLAVKVTNVREEGWRWELVRARVGSCELVRARASFAAELRRRSRTTGDIHLRDLFLPVSQYLLIFERLSSLKH